MAGTPVVASRIGGFHVNYLRIKLYASLFTTFNPRAAVACSYFRYNRDIEARIMLTMATGGVVT